MLTAAWCQIKLFVIISSDHGSSFSRCYAQPSTNKHICIGKRILAALQRAVVIFNLPGNGRIFVSIKAVSDCIYFICLMKKLRCRPTFHIDHPHQRFLFPHMLTLLLLYWYLEGKFQWSVDIGKDMSLPPAPKFMSLITPHREPVGSTGLCWAVKGCEDSTRSPGNQQNFQRSGKPQREALILLLNDIEDPQPVLYSPLNLRSVSLDSIHMDCGPISQNSNRNIIYLAVFWRVFI